jgi:hypothetical protein
MGRRLLLLLPLLALLLPAAADGDASYILQIDMYGANVVPPVETHAYGFVRFFFNEDRSEADYTVDIKGYSYNAVTGAAIRAGAPGQNGPLVFTLSDGDFIVTAGHLSLTPEQLKTFASGAWYVTLTTTFHPEGEMRGQIVVPSSFLTASGGAAYAPPSQAPRTLPPAPAATPASGSGTGLFQPPNTGDAGLKQD